MVPPLIALVLTGPTLAAVEPSSNMWVYVVTSTGGVALLTLIITTLKDLLKRSDSGKVVRNADMETQRNTAWKERNAERLQRLKEEARGNAKERNVRRVLDYAARLRRQLLHAGLTPVEEEPVLEDPEEAARAWESMND